MAHEAASAGRGAALFGRGRQHNPWAIAVVVSIATFMEVLDTTIANVSLRHIAGSLAISQDQSTYILTSYLVSATPSWCRSAGGWPPSSAASVSI